MQRSSKLPQVQYINKIIQKVQEITEVSQQQYMNVDVPAEIQCQNTTTHQKTVKDAQMQRQVHAIQKMPSVFAADIQNMLMPGSSEAGDDAAMKTLTLWWWTQPVNRETDISAEHVKEKLRAKEKQSPSPAEPFVVNYLCVERVHLPGNQQSRSGAMLSSGAGGGQKHGEVVNYHKVTLEEAETEPQPKSQW